MGPRQEERGGPNSAGPSKTVLFCSFSQALEAQQGVAHYRYERKGEGGRLGDAEVFEMLIENELTQDDVGGANRQLGFLFLYDLATAGVEVTMLGRDVRRSLAEILSPIFFLRHSMWGRSATSTAANQRHFAQLSVALAAPDGRWPRIPEADLEELAGTSGLDPEKYQDGQSAFVTFLAQLQQEHVDQRATPAYAARAAALHAAETARPARVPVPLPHARLCSTSCRHHS